MIPNAVGRSERSGLYLTCFLLSLHCRRIETSPPSTTVQPSWLCCQPGGTPVYTPYEPNPNQLGISWLSRTVRSSPIGSHTPPGSPLCCKALLITHQRFSVRNSIRVRIRLEGLRSDRIGVRTFNIRSVFDLYPYPNNKSWIYMMSMSI